MDPPRGRVGCVEAAAFGALLLLAAAVVLVLSVRIVDGPGRRSSSAIALLKTVDVACRSYRQETGTLAVSATHPPDGGIDSSRGLHELLGAVLEVRGGYGDGGPRRVGPLVRFEPNRLEGSGSILPTPPRRILDGWGRPIRYLVPGRHDPVVGDLWSRGPDDSGTRAE